LRTADAVSPVPGGSVLTTLLLFFVVYGIIFGAGIYYIAQLVRRGPGETPPLPDAGEGDPSRRPMAAGGAP
jgi:cytochrome d ubiquinol oxidase subunit I